MLALVTGSTGFIGSLLVDQLIASGIGVRIVVRPSSDLKWLPQDKIEVMTGSLQDPAFIDAAVDGCDLIYHVAGTLVANDLEAFRDVNVKPTRLLLEAAARNPQFKRFLLVSSQGASGPSYDGVPLTEESRANPVSDYGRTKLEAEFVALDFRDRVPVTIVRPSAVFGPRDANFLKLFKQVNKGVMPRFGKADRFSNLVYGPDLAEGIVKASLSDATVGEIYFMSNETPYPYDELVSEIEAALGTTCKRPVFPASVLIVAGYYARITKALTGKTSLLDEQRLATIRERYWTANCSKLKRELGWLPPTSLADGIRKTKAWYDEMGWL